MIQDSRKRRLSSQLTHESPVDSFVTKQHRRNRSIICMFTSQRHRLVLVSVGVFALVSCFGILFKWQQKLSTGIKDDYLSKNLSKNRFDTLRSNLSQSQALSSSWPESECTVWIAPTSIRGISGFGIFTTRDLQAGESILGVADGVSIPIEPFQNHDLPSRSERHQFINLFGEYAWGRGVPDHVAYEATGHVLDFQIGFGSLPNHHCVLSYLDMRYPNPPYDDSLVNRFTDPSAGAFSYNMGREFIVERPVKAGEEIFLNYGYCQRDDDSSPDWTSGMYMSEDFEEAAWYIKDHLKASPEWSLYNISTGKINLPSDANHMVESLLPSSSSEFQRLYGGFLNVSPSGKVAVKSATIVREVARHSLNRRKIEEIQSKGICMDNLRAHPSKIQLAGQGAYAQRTIQTGKVVTQAFFLHMVDKESLSMYNAQGQRNGTQILLNYCWGHRDSTLLLCPNTNAVLINHCSHRTKECGERGPNAEYRWSSDPSTVRWRNMSWQELVQQSGRGLAMDVVALRHIEPGEEVFVDYGVEWEEAWTMHLQKWHRPITFHSSWISARHANDDSGPILNAVVTHDLRQIAQHPYLFTGCLYRPNEWDVDKVFQKTINNWKTLSDDDLLQKYSDSGSEFVYPDQTSMYGHHRDHSHWPCSVIRSDAADNSSYLVRIHRAPWWDEDLPWHENDLPRLLRQYPRTSIHYFVHPFASDQHLKGVFRHEMRLRDDLFPLQWKNLLQKRSEATGIKH